MKIKLVTIDLSLTRAEKAGLAVGLCAAVSLAGHLALANPPKTFVAGETLTAADLNESFSQMPTVTEWATYAPVVTAGGADITITEENGSPATGFWRRVGDSIEVNIDGTLGGCTNGTDTIQFGLPSGLKIDKTKSATYTVVGEGAYRGSSTGTITQVTVFGAVPGNEGIVFLEKDGAVDGTSLSCGELSGGWIRIRLSAPVEGFTINTP
ncbi:MAG: hypothetical protein U0271_34960 [Polyangiaceae bacterium]